LGMMRVWAQEHWLKHWAVGSCELHLTLHQGRLCVVMGCGASVSSKAFSGKVATIIPNVNDSMKDQLVMVLGRVRADSELLMSPFGNDEGVAIRVKITRSNEQMAGQQKVMFSAFSVVNFKICDEDSKEIRIKTRAEGHPHFSYSLVETHVAWNIARDSAKGGMVSGGTKPGEFTAQELRPNAESFWKQFEAGKDHYHEITDMSGSGMQMNRCRKAFEKCLKVGDAVAVLGYCRFDEQGAYLEGSDESFITNDPGVTKALREVPEFKVAAADGITKKGMHKMSSEPRRMSK